MVSVKTSIRKVTNKKAIDLGSQATAGRHQEMFKFNPGKGHDSFPAYNASIRKCKNCKYNGTMKLAADIPNNELCGACKVVREDAPYSIVETEKRTSTNPFRTW